MFVFLVKREVSNKVTCFSTESIQRTSFLLPCHIAGELKSDWKSKSDKHLNIPDTISIIVLEIILPLVDFCYQEMLLIQLFLENGFLVIYIRGTMISLK